MRTWLARTALRSAGSAKFVAAALGLLTFSASTRSGPGRREAGGEASLKLPDLSQVSLSWAWMATGC